MQDDDESWLDALAGHGKDPAESATVEGQALRQVLLARGNEVKSKPAEHPAVAEQDPAREAELIAGHAPREYCRTPQRRCASVLRVNGMPGGRCNLPRPRSSAWRSVSSCTHA